ncbi:MAG: hypothetical protein KDJ99_09595, partial [Candidatus Competibacteraceae bacterium]|nr:hypothetical protein [Candidatus Competibacteraceae bacterium]
DLCVKRWLLEGTTKTAFLAELQDSIIKRIKSDIGNSPISVKFYKGSLIILIVIGGAAALTLYRNRHALRLIANDVENIIKVLFKKKKLNVKTKRDYQKIADGINLLSSITTIVEKLFQIFGGGLSSFPSSFPDGWQSI